jgi:hypothetical protein
LKINKQEVFFQQKIQTECEAALIIAKKSQRFVKKVSGIDRVNDYFHRC